MLFGSKKKKDPVVLAPSEDVFGVEINDLAKDVTKDYNIIADGQCYNLLYRDGQFLGIPQFHGGKIYPFSVDPTRPGSNGDKKQFSTAKVVCIPKDFQIIVRWGTHPPFDITDEQDGKRYKVQASGVFYVYINPTDAARDADRLYSKWMAHRPDRTSEALRDFLCHAFMSQIESEIVRYIRSTGKPVSNFVGNHPEVKLEASAAVYSQVKDIFTSIGLSMDKKSEKSIIEGLNVTPVQ